MKIYRIEYSVKGRVGNNSGWYDVPNKIVDVSCQSAERAIEAAKKYALRPQKFDDDGKTKTEYYKDFELTSARLIAEADIKA